MIKIVFFDIDGTLYYNKECRIVDSTLFALRELRKKGIKICICTSRSIEEMSKLPSFVFEEMDGIVCNCGGEMYINNKLVKHYPINQEVINKVINILDNNISVYRYSGINGINYLSQREDRVDAVFNSLYSMVPEKKKYEGEELTHLLFYTQDDKIRKQIVDCLQGETYINLKIANEIVAKGIEKASAMKIFAKEFYDINEDEIAAFGDGENDVKMLKEAALGIAMGNGCIECKEVADYITDTIENDGVYKALKHFELVD